uniref:Uncharacterized protein n=1 Tax=Oryza sativa subsp. japonica TaxID=39947 RepID=Q8S5Q1_ORYSJ|nr:Hypothetical protein [Oryza sativa Japonica Group]
MAAAAVAVASPTCPGGFAAALICGRVGPAYRPTVFPNPHHREPARDGVEPSGRSGNGGGAWRSPAHHSSSSSSSAGSSGGSSSGGHIDLHRGRPLSLIDLGRGLSFSVAFPIEPTSFSDEDGARSSSFLG